MTEWNRRVEVAQACVDRYFGKPLEVGKFDCVRLATFAAREMGWTIQLAKLGGFRTTAGALRAMRRLGFDSLMEGMDAQGFARIAPAKAWPGDIVGLPSDDGFGCALYVRLTNGRVLGFKDGACGIIQPHLFVAAWRL